MNAARMRSERRAAGEILSMDQTLRLLPTEVPVEDSFDVFESLGAVDVLPMPAANIEGPKFPSLRQLAHAVRQRAVSVFLRRFKAAEERRAAQEHSGIESVVTGKAFADLDHVISFAADLGCIVQVKNAIHFGVDREDYLIVGDRLSHQRFG